jgi:protein-disulfide isomerase
MHSMLRLSREGTAARFRFSCSPRPYLAGRGGFVCARIRSLQVARVAGLALVGIFVYWAQGPRKARPDPRVPAPRPPETLDLDRTPVKGAASAPLQVVEYSDFLCGGCRATANEFSRLLPLAGDRIAVHFKNYPLDSTCNPAVSVSRHPGACGLARAGICAHEQGKFWAYHDAVFASPPANPDVADLLKIGRELGLDARAFERCLGSDRTKRRLDAEVAEATRVGVQATPTVFINGRRVRHLQDFYLALEREARRSGVRSFLADP